MSVHDFYLYDLNAVLLIYSKSKLCNLLKAGNWWYDMILSKDNSDTSTAE